MSCTDNVLYIAYQLHVHVSHMVSLIFRLKFYNYVSNLRIEVHPLLVWQLNISLKYAFVIYIVNYYIKVYLVLKSPFQLFQ